MKKIFSALWLGVFCFCNANSQTVNDIPLKDIDVEYVQIVGTSKFFSTKATIDIDFGQRNKVWTNKDTKIKDANGEKWSLIQ